MYIEKVLDLWVQLMKNGGKNKSVFIVFLTDIYIYIISDNNSYGFAYQINISCYRDDDLLENTKILIKTMIFEEYMSAWPVLILMLSNSQIVLL